MPESGYSGKPPIGTLGPRAGGALVSPWFDARRAAGYLGVAAETVRKCVREGRIPVRGHIGGAFRLHRDDLDAFLESNPPGRFEAGRMEAREILRKRSERT